MTAQESSFEHAALLMVVVNGEEVEAAEELASQLDHHRGAPPSVVLKPPIAPNDWAAIAGSAELGGCLVFGKMLESFELDPELPVVVISKEPPTRPVTCWFAKPPALGVLAALFKPSSLLGAKSRHITHRPRRKTDTIIGNSPSLQALLHDCNRLAPLAATVLISGETGTGKELVARSLHYCGPRSAKPFVAINCAAIPETMMEAELFGHQRGAFTGAVAARPGAFEAAEGGTLFLDEIGELPLAMQPKLLRVLDAGEVTRLGSNTPITTSCRVVAATNRDLEEEVAEGRFREDLYYRIGVHALHVPPLRMRPDDIPALVKHHLTILTERENTPPRRLTSAAIAKLLSHGWPGNVRELIATVERAVLVAKSEAIDADDISLPRAGNTKAALLAYRDAKAEFERSYFASLMRATGGNVSMAATIAKKTRKEIYEAMRRTGVESGRNTGDHNAPKNATKSDSSASVKSKPNASS